MNLEKAFAPETYESRVKALWEAAQAFVPRPGGAAGVFSLVIPPPNVTGSLHIGHALDYTLQDILVRWHRMLGEETLWVPGCDHAGIATQMVVERHLAAQGRTRHELGREKFLEEVWRWKDQYRERIVGTLQRMGCSCDWSRERFTLDPGLSRAVRETFVRLYEQKLIYRGTRLINWCTDCNTALSDLEVLREEPETGELWSFAYPVRGGGEIVVATTRPETMLGDTAVAVHPEDPRWQQYIGREIEHPFFPERRVIVVGDPILADPETGTGAVKVTPAHDFNDFECGRRHGLPMISILDSRGFVNENGGPFSGLDRLEARERVKQALTTLGLFRGAKPHLLSPGRCQRSGSVVEPLLSTQWFLKMEDLAAPALQAVRGGDVVFVPNSWEKTYFHWLENIEDWCISRQLWWGHRIPAWYCRDCGQTIVARETPAACPKCSSAGLDQDPDVLDTWFSSQLWPFSVFGWPDPTPDLARYYPTSVLVTGFDIIFFWVARMVMAGMKLAGDVPFRTVLYHGLVRDAHGQKMSKSRGNAIDPADIMDQHGVDAVRFTLAAQSSPGTDLALSEERLAGYRAFMNKLWNAARFVLMKLPEGGRNPRVDYAEGDLDDIDRYLISRFRQLVGRVDEALGAFRFDHAAEAIYHFLWGTFCDWSIELAKPDLGEEADPRRRAVRLAVLLDVLDGALRLLHPIAPFITEELWQHLPRREGDPEVLVLAPFPTPAHPGLPLPAGFDEAAVTLRVERWLIAPVTGARTLRAEAGVAPSKKVQLSLRPRLEEGREHLPAFAPRIAALCGAAAIEVREAPWGDEPAKRQVLETVEVILPLAGAIDLGEERTRLDKERQKLQKDLEGLRRRLDNSEFVSKAPAEVVAKERARMVALAGRLGEVDRLLDGLRE